MGRFEAWMDGQPLSGLGPGVCLTDVLEPPPRLRASLAPLLNRDGARLTLLRREALRVTLCLALRARDPGERDALLDALLAWASGEQLALSTRPGRFLAVRFAALDAALSALRWTETLRLTFTACEIPFWQAEQPDALSLSGSGAEGTLFLRGTADSWLEACVRAEDALVTELSLARGEERITLADIRLSAGDELRLGHDRADRLTLLRRAADGSTDSLLQRLTPGSADDIRLSPGPNALSLRADAPVRARLTGRGRWL